MKVDGMLGWQLDAVGDEAAALEELGYAGAMSVETAHDPFFPLLVAAQRTKDIDLMTSIAVAFARSPMTLANIAYDLQLASKGRMILGLGLGARGSGGWQGSVHRHGQGRGRHCCSDAAARLRV